MIYFKKNMYLTYFEVYKKCCYSMMSAVYSVHLSSTFVFRYLANLVKERDGFELVIEVRWYWFLERHQNNGQWILIGSLNLKLSWLNILWLLVLSFLKCCFSIIEWVWGFFFQPECTNVCFWYIPASMRDQTRDADWWERLGKVHI